jgi:hypothetical protein
VGVRFGGSEHHRIETSSSHTRPPPFGVGTPGQRDRANGALRSTGRQVPPGQGRAASSEDERLRSVPGSGKRRSSEHRASSLGEVRQAALFGAPGVEPRGTGKPELFGARATQYRPASEHPLRLGQDPDPTGHGRRRSSEHRASHLGGRRTRALRSTGEPAPPGPGNRNSSEDRQASSTGQGNRHSSEGRQASSTRPGDRHSSEGRQASFTRPGNRHSSEGWQASFIGTGNQRLFGAEGTPPQSGQDHPASRDQANGAPRSTARRVSTGWAPALGAKQTVPFGESRAELQRDREPAALRSRGHPTSRVGTPRLTGPGKGRSSEHHAPGFTDAEPPALFGATATRHRSGQSHGDTGPPAPRGRLERQAKAGNHRCTSRASVCGDRQGHRPRSGTAPGRMVTAGRQRPQ